MEPSIMPVHSSSPPSLDVDGSEDEFGDFGGFSVGTSRSPPGFSDSTDPPSCLKKAAIHPFNSSFEPAVDPSHTVPSRGQICVEVQDCRAEASSHLTNGYAEADDDSSARGACVVGTFSPEEETGFADFSVFAEQASHPWCCGFSPLSNTEKWAAEVEATFVMDSEPKSHCAHKAKEKNCTKVKHCEDRDPTISQQSQDHHHHHHHPPPQEAAAAAVGSEESRFVDEDVRRRVESWRDARRHLKSLQSSVDQEDGESERDRKMRMSPLPPTLSAYDSASEDMVCDDFSFEGASADLEPNVSSLGSQATDWDRTDDEEEDGDDDEEMGNYTHVCGTFGNSSRSVANLSQSEAEKGFHHYEGAATQETSATSNHSHTGEEFAVFSDGQQTADVNVQSLGSLPPSDSFADFCSAPTQEDGEHSWADFQDPRDQEEEEEETWTRVRDGVSSPQTDGCTEEGLEAAGPNGVLRRNSCQASFSCRVQQLLSASFPEVLGPALEVEEEEEEEDEEVEEEEQEEEEALTLSSLLHTQHLSENEEEMPKLSRAQWVQLGLWWPHQDVHSAVGLRFQWAGSHTNRTLLRCLGVDTRNIVFIGVKKQPVAVPAFASSLGMLEPTKDSVGAHAAAEAPEPQDVPNTSTDSVQGALSSSLQQVWSSRGLSSSSQDEIELSPSAPESPHPPPVALNLDYFGPEEESESSSRGNSPPPGVDRELYELTISKLETSSCHLEDTLNFLMSAAEKTSTTVRKPQQDEELSAEAGRVIAGLPYLSFMKAKVLMFPSVLIPRESSDTE